MSKKIKFAIIVALICVATVGLVACEKPQEIDGLNDLGTLNYTSYNIVDGLDSIEVFNSALSYMANKDNFSYEILFNFATDIQVATQASREFIKKDNGKVWHEQVVVGTGQGKAHRASLRFYDGTTAKVVANDPNGKDAKDRVPGFDIKDNQNLFAYDLSNIASKDIEGNVPDYEYCNNFASYKDYMYDRAAKYFWLYKAGEKDLSEHHSSKVYKKGDYYYCDITIDTINCVKEKNQPDVVKDIESGVGMKINGFKHDTILRLRLEKDGESYRFVDTRLEEGYKSTLTGASQNFQRKYYYSADKYIISNDNIKLFN